MLTPRILKTRRSSRGDRDRRGRRQRVHERATEDELDVQQAVLDHRVGERQRDQRQGQISEQLHREAGLEAQREWRGVEDEERQHPGASPPHEPLDLPPHQRTPGVTVRVDEYGEADREQHAEVQRLGAVDGGAHLPQHPPGAGRHEEHLARHRGASQRQRRQVRGGDHPGPALGKLALGERETEVQKHDRQEEDREVVGPEEDPVEQVELPRERGRVHQEEENADDEEMQRGWIRPAPQHHDRPDHETEEADEREVVEERDVALRERRHLDLERASLVDAQHRIVEVLPRSPSREDTPHLPRIVDLLPADPEQHVTDPHARTGRRPIDRDARGDDSCGRRLPEDAVVDERPGRLGDDVVDPESGEQHRECQDDGLVTKHSRHARQPRRTAMRGVFTAIIPLRRDAG